MDAQTKASIFEKLLIFSISYRVDSQKKVDFIRLRDASRVLLVHLPAYSTSMILIFCLLSLICFMEITFLQGKRKIGDKMEFLLKPILIILSTIHVFAQVTNQETSKYGTFSIKEINLHSNVYFKRINGKTIKLFNEDIPAYISSEKQIGTTKLPILTVDGQEFHLFSFNMFGNTCEGSEFHLVIVTKDKVWATPTMFGMCETIEKIKISTDGGLSKVSFIVPPTIESVGHIYTASFGNLDTIVIPKLRDIRTIKNKRYEYWTGLLINGCHASNWIPMLEKNGKITIFTNDGNCKLESYINKKVIVQVEIKVWSDGNEEITCKSIKQRDN